MKIGDSSRAIFEFSKLMCILMYYLSVQASGRSLILEHFWITATFHFTQKSQPLGRVT